MKKNTKNKIKIYLALSMMLTTLSSCKKYDAKNEEANNNKITYEDQIKPYNITIETPVPTPTPTPQFIYKDAYLLNDETVYDNYMNPICTIEKYQKVKRCEIGTSYDPVILNDGTTGFINKYNLEYLPDSYVEVDISDQKVYVIKNEETLLSCDVVTGTPTVGEIPGTNLGYQEILEKTYNRPLIGETWNVDVNYFFPFNSSGEGFHDASWRSEFGGEIYTYNGSHGCVNMKYDDVKEMDNLIEVGTKVLVHK